MKGHPDEPRYWLILANVLLSANRKLEAITMLETAAGAGIAREDELVLLGDLYAERRMHPEALAIYSKLLKPVPETGEEKLLRYAESLAASGRTKEAAATLAALPADLSAKGKSRQLLVQADIESAAHDLDAARRTIESLLADEPLNGRALLALGKINVKQGDDAHAGFTFDTATRVPEAAYRAHLELANLELRQRRYSRSVTHLEAALKIERSDAVADYLARVRGLAGEGDAKDR
jgi:predicted Zn-dependent protease